MNKEKPTVSFTKVTTDEQRLTLLGAGARLFLVVNDESETNEAFKKACYFVSAVLEAMAAGKEPIGVFDKPEAALRILAEAEEQTETKQ